jgi:hypothetical protein
MDQDVDLNLHSLGNLECGWSGNPLSSIQQKTNLRATTRDILGIKPRTLPIFYGVEEANGWKGALSPKFYI